MCKRERNICTKYLPFSGIATVFTDGCCANKMADISGRFSKDQICLFERLGFLKILYSNQFWLLFIFTNVARFLITIPYRSEFSLLNLCRLEFMLLVTGIIRNALKLQSAKKCNSLFAIDELEMENENKNKWEIRSVEKCLNA